MPHSYSCRHLLGGLLLAAALPLAARAQATFQPGYAVLPAGDTLRGEIDTRDGYVNATQCRFRLAPAAAARTYRPAELRGYGLPSQGLTYRSLRLPGSSGPAGELVFAEVLVSGPATLYATVDADRADHFYLEAPQFALAELARRRLLLPGSTDATNYRDQPVYRITLAQALPNCPAAERQLPQLPLTAAALKRVVRAFNACRGVAPVTAAIADRPHAQVGLLLGATAVRMNLVYPGSSAGQNTTLDPPTVAFPVLGPCASLPLGNKLGRKLSAELALFYVRQRYVFPGSPVTFYTQRQDLDFTLGYLRLPVLLRFTPRPRARFRPVLEAGITLAYATTLDATITTTDYYNRVTTKPFFGQERFQEGLVLGVGVQRSYWQGRRATALVRVEGDTGWTEGRDLNTTARRYYLLLALDLTK